MDIQKHDNILHNLKIIIHQLDQEWLETLLNTISIRKYYRNIYIQKWIHSKRYMSSRQPIIYDTQIPINIKEIMLETKPIVLLQTSIKADTFEGSLLNGLIDV